MDGGSREGAPEQDGASRRSACPAIPVNGVGESADEGSGGSGRGRRGAPAEIGRGCGIDSRLVGLKTEAEVGGVGPAGKEVPSVEGREEQSIIAGGATAAGLHEAELAVGGLAGFAAAAFAGETVAVTIAATGGRGVGPTMSADLAGGGRGFLNVGIAVRVLAGRVGG